MAGRPVSGGDPAKREAMRAWYRNLSPAAKRDWVARRDPQTQRDADNRRYRRDAVKRIVKQKQINQNADPTKLKARSDAGKAKATGRISVHSCARCGARGNIQMHHPRHSMPLRVVPLCPSCHGKESRTTNVRQD